MRFEQRRQNYYCYGPNRWMDDPDEENMRGTLIEYDGRWYFAGRLDRCYTAEELQEIAAFLSDLNSKGMKP